MKRAVACILTIFYLATHIFGSLKAEASSGMTADQIRQQINSTYAQALTLSGLSSFYGLCGAYVGQQLSILGINAVSYTHLTLPTMAVV